MATEREVKLELACPEYERLLQHLESRVVEQQENQFFDTAGGLLLNNGWALRLRSSGEHHWVTLKGPSTIRDGIHERPEFEARITRTAAEQVKHHPSQMLTAITCPRSIRERLTDQTLVCVGGFSNERRHVDVDGVHLELDRTRFPGNVYRYELELELSEHANEEQATLERILKRLSIPMRFSEKSKYQWLLTYLGKAS